MSVDRVRTLEMLKEGHTNPVIARQLRCTPQTVGRVRKAMIDAGHLDLRFKRSRRDVDPLLDPDDAPAADLEADELDDELEEIEAVEDVDDVLELETPSGSAVVDDAKARTAAAILAVREKRAELELARVERDLASMQSPEPPPPVAVPGADPILQVVMQQNQALLGHILKKSEVPAAAVPVTAGGLAEMIPLVGSLLTFAREFGGGAEDPSAASDPVTAMINLVAKNVGSRGLPPPSPPLPPGTLAAAPATLDTDVPTSSPPEPPRFDPEAEGRTRASKWVGVLQEELQVGADARSTADHLYPHLGSLPGDLRSAIQSEPVEALVGTLRRYLPSAQLDALVSTISGSEQSATWLGNVLLELREATDEPVGVGTNGAE